MARKKKRSNSKYFFKIIFWLALACMIVYYAVDYFVEASDVFYPDFQIAIPRGYQIHGIDVSKYQNAINWKEVKNMDADGIKIGFAFIKATEGVGNVDNQFRRNWLKAEEEKKSFGVSSTEIKKEVTEWLEIVEKYYKVKPIIYTNIDFYNRYLLNSFDDYPVWIAHYLQPVKPRIDHKWVFWQHSESGRVNGIKAPVDFNVFSGDSSDFENLLIQ